MATILFWNINKKPLIEDVVHLCHNNDVDILLLAESAMSDVEVQKALNTNNSRGVYLPWLNSESARRLAFFFKYPTKSVRRVSDDAGISIRQIIPPIGIDILLVGVHLPSKLHMDEREQMFHAARVVRVIEEAERRVGHERTLVMGDFNMNPFEAGVVASDGLHAVMDQNIARRRNRQVQGESKSFFYNPMWGRMGDSSPGAAGTYYYKGSGYINYFWNTFDQVLLRPDLFDYFSQKDLKVIAEIGPKQLLDKAGILNTSSDHLPVMLTLRIDRIASNGQ